MSPVCMLPSDPCVALAMGVGLGSGSADVRGVEAAFQAVVASICPTHRQRFMVAALTAGNAILEANPEGDPS
jgi:hypothetical protein